MIDALLQVGANLIGGWLGKEGQEDTNSANAAMAREQMEFQREMSNTAYRRAAADMQAAGLNPALAAKLGPASTPPGALAMAGNEMGAALSGASSAGQASMQHIQRSNMMAQGENLRAQADVQRAQADVLRATVPKILADTNVATNSAANLLSNTDMLKALIPKIAAEIDNLHSQAGLARSGIPFREAETARSRMESERIGVDIGRIQSISDLNEAQRKLVGQLILNQPELRKLWEASRTDTNASELLKRLMVPRAENEAGAQDSWYMKHIAPYLPSLLNSTNSAAGVIRSLR